MTRRRSLRRSACRHGSTIKELAFWSAVSAARLF